MKPARILSESNLRRMVLMALREDVGGDDITTRLDRDLVDTRPIELSLADEVVIVPIECIVRHGAGHAILIEIDALIVEVVDIEEGRAVGISREVGCLLARQDPLGVAFPLLPVAFGT